MSQITIRCAGCGAAVRYDPTSESLKCPYCGHTEALPATQSRIRGNPPPEALEEVPAPSGKNIAHHRVQSCQSCGAAIAYDENRVSKRCDFCGAEAVGEALLTEQPIQPQGVLPFRITPGRGPPGLPNLAQNTCGLPLSDLTKKSPPPRAEGASISPLWDVLMRRAHATWRAVPGYYRTRTEILLQIPRTRPP
jgi:predicted RNA-binding Zn-ribbon protein involved in translation (DUF1610 family)